MRLFSFAVTWLIAFNCFAAQTDEKAPAKRIVALAPHIVEMLYEIGAGDNIVGTLAHADYPESAKDIPRIGDYKGVNFEQLLALKPDLVIAWQGGNNQQDIEKIKSLGIDIAFSSPTKIENVAKELRLFGQLTGYEVNAEKQARAFESALNQLKQDYQNKQTLSVFYQLWDAPLTTVRSDTWLSKQVEICGGKTIFDATKTPYPQVSIEAVIAQKPQVIVVPMSGETSKDVSEFWHGWVDIPAVKHKQFIITNADLVHRFTPRMLSGISDMCEKMDAARKIYQ
ncbi:cobalamin-binding protein [Thalassotalea agarivorans]|uniref:Vitamin B12 transport system substrate-binding protein n=1 Tax=Thalassotalea agarivorans TaxID=349064 RepID=A0A1I0G815_THASX|nr:cobalamin-binding protein [Thalassotalea agarivorans]SET66790.1 vitamin B12 transport system substrate-binding protein [Thalassotalea agarivorans]